MANLVQQPLGSRDDRDTHGFRQDLRRWQHLVQPRWLTALFAGQAVPAAPAGDWCVLEVGCGDRAAYDSGHIAGAHYLDTHQFEAEPHWNKVPDATLLQLLLGLGLCHDTTVVLYGRNNLTAARAAHLLLYAGVHDVRLLDGGLAAWLRAGLPVATQAPPARAAAARFGGVFPAHPHYLIGTTEAQAMLQHGASALVSIRTWNEFMGRTSGYRYISARGDIPGALWGHAGQDGDVHSMSAFQCPDGTMLAARAIAQVWGDADIHPGLRIAFYCGTGWRASLAFFYAWLMGWERICVYDGGWYEWSSHPENPGTLNHDGMAD